MGEEKTRKKCLVIDDNPRITSIYKIELGDYVDLGIEFDLVHELQVVNKDKSMDTIRDYLEKTQYGVIFMDGQLYLELSPPMCDGEVLVRAIRDGAYGKLNMRAEIQNISGAYMLTTTRKDVQKEPFSAYGCPIAYAIKKLDIREQDRVFGEDELSVTAINAFAELRGVQQKWSGNERKDDTFTFLKLDGQIGEFTTGKLMECDEFADFVKGHKGMRHHWSKSYYQGYEKGMKR